MMQFSALISLLMLREITHLKLLIKYYSIYSSGYTIYSLIQIICNSSFRQ